MPTYAFRSPDGSWSYRLLPGRSAVVGRAGQGADISFDDNRLSRQHLHLTNDGEACVIEHLRTRGTIYVNGLAIPREGPVPLAQGDRIELVGGLTLFVAVEIEGH